jgi:peptide deformylase
MIIHIKQMIYIKKINDPILRTPCKPVSRISRDVLHVADKLRFAMLNQSAHGIAANQIGFDKAMFVYSFEKEVNKVVVNPIMISNDRQITLHEEGCLSIPDMRYSVPRYDTIKVEYMNLKGDLITDYISGFKAYIFQHEIDHLNSKLIVDYEKEEI